MSDLVPTKPATLPVALDAELAARLDEHAADARGALAENTTRALKSDSAIFTAWCSERGLSALPATPETVAAFIDAMAEHRKPATVRRYAASIAHMHRAAQAGEPTRSEKVRLALKRMARARGTRQGQAAPLNRPAVDAALQAAGGRLIDLRNKALLAVAYDTLARRSELVALAVEDVQVAEDGTGSALIRRSKGDQEGEGSVRFLGRDTVAYLRAWLEAAGITAGTIFRSVTRQGRVGKPLHPNELPRIWRDMARTAGVDPAGLSGHSTRIGAAQDMVAAGIELASVMQAGAWKSPAMPARYSERLQAKRGGAAKLARLQGRA